MTKLKEQLFKEIEYVLSKLFICPLSGISKKNTVCYYFILLLLIITSVQLFVTLCFIGFSDWLEIIMLAPNMGACFMSTIKYSVIHKNKIFFNKTFTHFQNELWDLIPGLSKENVKTFIKYKAIMSFLNRFFNYAAMSLLVVVDSMPWLIMNYENKLLGKDSKYLYPFDAVYPFDKVKWYWVAYIWESLMTALVIIIFNLSNLINLSIVSLICMELTLLGNCLQELLSHNDVRNITLKIDLKSTHDNIKSKLKWIIKRHTFIANMTSEFDFILGDVMFISYFFGLVFICLTAFSFTVVDDLYKRIRYFSFFLSLLIEMFGQCVIGQVLIDHSEQLAQNIYYSDWIYADAETKRILLIFMMRTQKTFKLTGNNYLCFNLNTFSQICSSSYQLFNLIRTVYVPSKDTQF